MSSKSPKIGNSGKMATSIIYNILIYIQFSGQLIFKG